MRFAVVYDACVLYPAPLRDFLLRLACSGLFAAKWSNRIHEEWVRGLLRDRPELEDRLQRTCELMNEAVPDCLVEGYEDLEEGLKLPDPNDRHVLAAAIRSGAQAIITFNQRDFPAEQLGRYDIEALHPDVFVVQQMDLADNVVASVARGHRAALRNPPKSVTEYLDTLSAQGLVVTAERLASFEALI